MKQLTSEGIVLSRTDYGEADRIVTFLTPHYGKVRVMAKGVRKIKSKLAGGIELFSVSQITFIQGRGDLHTLVSSRLEKHYGAIVTDIDRTMLGYDILKILSRVLEDEAGEDFYRLLQECLVALNDLAASKELAEGTFLLQLMRLLGHLPSFTHTVQGEPLPKEATFQFNVDDMAFFVMPNGPFTLNHIKLLRLMSHNPAESLKNIDHLKEYLTDIMPIIRSMARLYVIPF